MGINYRIGYFWFDCCSRIGWAAAMGSASGLFDCYGLFVKLYVPTRLKKMSD